MWNSNSVTAWLIARSGLDTESIHPPTAGRAPGWQAGLVIARRQEAETPPAPLTQRWRAAARDLHSMRRGH
jgi:hypothetical protein